MSINQTINDTSRIHHYYGDLQHGRDMVLRENVTVITVSNLSYQFLNGERAPEPTNLLRPDVWQEEPKSVFAPTAGVSRLQQKTPHISRMPRYQLRNIFGETFGGWNTAQPHPMPTNDQSHVKKKRSRHYGYEAFLNAV